MSSSSSTISSLSSSSIILLLPASLIDFVFKWCISSTIITSGFNCSRIPLTLSFSPYPEIVWYSIHSILGIYSLAAILRAELALFSIPYSFCISSIVLKSPPIYRTIYSYIWSLIAFLGDKNRILSSGCSKIYFNVTNDFPHPVGNITAAFPFSSNNFITSLYASSWCSNSCRLLFSILDIFYSPYLRFLSY